MIPQVRKNFPLTHLNGYRLKVNAQYFIETSNLEHLMNLVQDYEKITFWGKGFNTLPNGNISGLVVKLKDRNTIQEIRRDKTYAYLKIPAGYDFPRLVKDTIKLGYYGLENLTLIYGSLGGAIVSNAGAYGKQISEFVTDVTVLDLKTRKIYSIDNAQCKFRYRSSIFQQNPELLIIEATIKLSLKPQTYIPESLKPQIFKYTRPPLTPSKIVYALTKIRTSKFTDAIRGYYGTCGSHFKNPIVPSTHFLGLRKELPNLKAYPPNGMHAEAITEETAHKFKKVKLPAGQLLDILGYKNKWKGNVGTLGHAQHVVTKPGATPEEIISFTNRMQKDVYKNFGIELLREVRIVCSNC